MRTRDYKVLAIESSCDDTGVAVIEGRRVLSNVVAGQEVHAQYGGVVPELASRAHEQHIVPTVVAALKEAGVKAEDLDCVAYTQGPGLHGSLLVGGGFAKAWAWAHGLPTVPVNHMHAHVLAHFLEPGEAPEMPFLCLTVSGGHTQIIRVDAPDRMTILGTTRDDAAGEAFDKIAKLMGLEYPGGPLIDALAREGNPKAFAFTRPKVPRLDMSFSGLKTQVLYFLQRELQKNPDFVDQYRADIAASVQFAILDILMHKLDSAVEQTGIRTVAIAGGVSANSGLRAALESRSNTTSGTAPGPASSAPAPWTIHIPPMAYCTDNAAMIAIAGSLSFGLGKRGALDDVPNPRLTF